MSTTDEEVVELGMPSGEQCARLEKLRELRGLKQLTDFKIRVVEDGSVRCVFEVHRVVLAASEGFFAALVNGGGVSMVENERGTVDLSEVDGELLGFALDYCYGAPRLAVPKARVLELLGVAVRFQVSGLVDQCASLLKKGLNERNCCRLFAAADVYGRETLRSAARDAVIAWLPTLLRDDADDNNNGTNTSSSRARSLSVSKEGGLAVSGGGGCSVSSEQNEAGNYSSKQRPAARRRAAEREKVQRIIVDDTATEDSNRKLGFATLPAALAKEVLKSDDVSCDENVVFEAALAWAAKAKERRDSLQKKKKRKRASLEKGDKKGDDKGSCSSDDEVVAYFDDSEIDDLLSCVRYPLMDATYLADVVKPHPMMRTRRRQALVFEAFEHIALVAAGRTETDERGMLDDDTYEREEPAARRRLEEEARLKRFEPRKRRAVTRPWPPRFPAGARTFEASLGHSDAVAALCVCADKVVSGSWDSTVKVWNADTGGCEKTLEDHEGTVRALCNANGRLVSAAEDGAVYVWDPDRDWALLRTLGDHSLVVVNALVALRPPALLQDDSDDASDVVIEDNNSQVADMAPENTTTHTEAAENAHEEDDDDEDDATGQQQQQPPGGSQTFDNVTTESTTPQRRSRRRASSLFEFASGSDDGSIKIWSASNLRCQLTLHTGDNVGILVLAAMPGKLACGADDGSIRIYDTRTWALVHTVAGETDENEEIWALAVVGDYLVSGSVNATIRVWNTHTWACEKDIVSHDGPVYALATLQNHLVSGSSDETIAAYGLDWEPEIDVGNSCSGVWALTVHNDRIVSGGVNGTFFQFYLNLLSSSSSRRHPHLGPLVSSRKERVPLFRLFFFWHHKTNGASSSLFFDMRNNPTPSSFKSIIVTYSVSFISATTKVPRPP